MSVSILYMDVSPSYTLAVNTELRQKSLVQFQAILSLLLGRLWTVVITENARFKCFCHDSSCVFREGGKDVKLPEPCPLVLLLMEWCFWWFRENKFWRFSMWITLILLLCAYTWHDCVCVCCMLWGCFMFSKHDIHQTSLPQFLFYKCDFMLANYCIWNSFFQDWKRLICPYHGTISRKSCSSRGKV